LKNALILGGTGFVGRHVCEKLQRAGWHITVPTRRAINASAVQHLPGLTVIEADVHDEAALARLLSGHDVVVNLVAILHGSEAAFERTHVELPTKLARACVASCVRRVVHVSALGVSAESPSRYQRSKARGEALLRAAEWVEDVASAVVACAKDSGLSRSSVGQTYECAGPAVLTLADLVRLAGRFGSRQRPILPLPMALGRLQALMMELAPGEPLMSRDNLDAMSVDNVASGQWPGLMDLGIRPAAVAAVAPTYLGGHNSRSRLLVLRRR
jgi:NADH dehydrogenase